MKPSILLVALGLLLACAVGELLLRATDIDRSLITRALFFQGADIEVHEISPDPVLHYVLKPGTQYEGDLGRHYVTHIDEHGARFPTHPAAKAPGVFRILCAGSSTTYGSAVNDGETIPARLESRLNASAADGMRYEAWNFGTSGYTQGQVAHLARLRLRTTDPDLVVVQLARMGRRAFLMPQSGQLTDYPWPEILADPVVFEEQLAFPHWLPARLQLPLLRHSALARALTAALPGFGPSTVCDVCVAMDIDESKALYDVGEALRIPVVFYSIPAYRGLPKPNNVFPSLPAERFIDLHQPDREPEFYEVHPPPATLDEFARLLADQLTARGLLQPRRP